MESSIGNIRTTRIPHKSIYPPVNHCSIGWDFIIVEIQTMSTSIQLYMQYITINIFITAIIHCKNFKSHQEYLKYKYVVITWDKSWVYKEISKMFVDNHKIKQEIKNMSENNHMIQWVPLLQTITRVQYIVWIRKLSPHALLV
jgi:hypothetical protein